MTMQVLHRSQIYCPKDGIEPPILVCFDDDPRTHQDTYADRAIEYLDGLPHEALVLESQRFFKFVVMFHVSHTLMHYTVRLLGYFHLRGLLRCKRVVNTETKQQKRRYLVMFDVGSGLTRQVFTQTYNSIRELKADTGKKPCQIKPELTTTMMCQALHPKNT